MEEVFVDTNVFLRFLLKDDEKKAQNARHLLAKALKGEILLRTSELVVAEMVWTLESFYKIPKAEIQEKIQVILQSEGLEVPNRNLLLLALLAYKELNVDFIDAYNAHWARANSLSRFLSYDRKHMKRFDFLQVQEP